MYPIKEIKNKKIIFPVVPVPPVLSITSSQPSSLSLSWPSHPDGGSPVTLYKVFTREATGLWTGHRAGPGDRELVIGDLR